MCIDNGNLHLLQMCTIFRIFLQSKIKFSYTIFISGTCCGLQFGGVLHDSVEKLVCFGCYCLYFCLLNLLIVRNSVLRCAHGNFMHETPVVVINCRFRSCNTLTLCLGCIVTDPALAMALRLVRLILETNLICFLNDLIGR
jgi:hypothetical protein